MFVGWIDGNFTEWGDAWHVYYNLWLFAFIPFCAFCAPLRVGTSRFFAFWPPLSSIWGLLPALARYVFRRGNGPCQAPRTGGRMGQGSCAMCRPALQGHALSLGLKPRGHPSECVQIVGHARRCNSTKETPRNRFTRAPHVLY